jgi:hypothetical protein
MNKYIVAFLIGGAFFWFFNGKDSWLGFYYPNGCLTCTEDYIFSPQFDSKQQCFDWANNLKRSRNNSSDDFECGSNCKEVGYKAYRCDETVDY